MRNEAEAIKTLGRPIEIFYYQEYIVEWTFDTVNDDSINIDVPVYFDIDSEDGGFIGDFYTEPIQENTGMPVPDSDYNKILDYVQDIVTKPDYWI